MPRSLTSRHFCPKTRKQPNSTAQRGFAEKQAHAYPMAMPKFHSEQTTPPRFARGRVRIMEQESLEIGTTRVGHDEGQEKLL